MGTDETSNKNNDSLYFDDLDDVSDFYGLKSQSKEENISTKEEETISLETNNNLNSKTSESYILIPTTFEWDGGGKSIYVTGSFCKWEQFFLMKRKTKNSYFLTLNLPKGYHQYKFKIDDEWKYNNKYPTCNDGGNINNYLDTTNSDKTTKNSDEGATTISTNVTDNYIDNSRVSKKNVKNILQENYELNQEKKDIRKQMKKLDKKIPSVPIQYNKLINIDLINMQNELGEKRFLETHEKNILSDNLSYKKINFAPIEQYNHLDSKNDKGKSVVIAVSSRYRFKTTTLVYYKPKNK